MGWSLPFRTKFFVHLSSPPPRLHYHNIMRGPIQNTFLLHNVLILEGWWDNDSYESEWYPSILAESIYYFIFIQVSKPSPLCETVSEPNSNESRLLPAQPDRSVDYRKSYELGEDFFLYRRKQPMHRKGQGDKQEHLIEICLMHALTTLFIS